jgi:tRNA-5-methyluridine54 2-sulfurtransferase
MFDRDARILVAVSGGKDSLALWDVLLRAGYRADALTINLGIGSYSTKSLAKTRRYADCYPEAKLLVYDLRIEAGESLREIAQRVRRARDHPCSLCGLVKRHVMNQVARDGEYDVLATGHNLDDEAATLFGNLLNWQMGYLTRQAPVLPARADGLVRKVKPFCRFYERETAAYAILRDIDYMLDECPHAAGATSLEQKAVLNQLEHLHPGTKTRFYLGFLRSRAEGLFRYQENSVPGLHPCEACGQPTSAPELCAFCRLWRD